MSDVLATKYVEIKLKQDELERQLNQVKNKIDGQATAFNDMFKSGAKMVGGLVAGYQALSSAISFGVDSVKQFIESAGAYKKVEAIVYSTGKAAGFAAEELANISGELSKLAGIDDDKIMNDVTANLLTFKNVSGDVFKSAQQSILDISAVIGSDLKSQTIQLGKALNDPIAGMGALARVGIQFSDSQKEQIKTMIQHNDLLGAQKLMLKEIESEFGGAAEASNKASGGLNTLMVAFGNFKEFVGGAILKAISPFVSELTNLFESLIPVKTNLESTQESTGKLASRFESLSGTVERLGGKTNKSAEEQRLFKESLSDLLKEYPNYFKGMDSNATKFDTIKTAISQARIELDKYIDSLIKQAIIQDKQNDLVEAGKKLYNATKLENSVALEYNKAEKNGTLDKVSENPVAGMSGVRTYGGGVTNRELLKIAADNAKKAKSEAQAIIDNNKKEIDDLSKGIIGTTSPKNPIVPKTGKADISSGDKKEMLNVQLEMEKIHAKQVQDIRQKAIEDAQVSYDSDIDRYQKAVDKKELSESDFNKLKIERLNQLQTEQQNIVSEFNKKESLETIDTEYQKNQQLLELHKATEVQRLEATKQMLQKKLEAQKEYDKQVGGGESTDTKQTKKDISSIDAQILIASNEAKLNATKEHYEQRKFLDESYYDWKKEQIQKEYELNIANGLSEVQAHADKNEALKELDNEHVKFILDNSIIANAAFSGISNAFSSLTDIMFGDAEASSFKIVDVYKKMAKQVINELLKIAAQKAALGLLNLATGGLGSIFGVVGGLLGGLFGGGSSGADLGGKSFSGEGTTGLFAKNGNVPMTIPILPVSNDSQAGLAQINESIQALNMNLINKEFASTTIIEGTFKEDDFAIRNKNAEARVLRNGKNINAN